jgi:predicted RecA/RadA family phage recombinase
MKTSTKIVAVLAIALCGLAAQACGIDASAFLSPEVAMGLSGAGALLSTGYSHDGKVIDYVNTTGAAIGSGDVVKMGNVLGVALVDIAIGATGAVGFGVFRGIPKVAAAVFAQGESLTWDVSAGKFDDNLAVPAAGDVTAGAAFAAAAGANLEATCTVMFTGVPGTVTP